MPAWPARATVRDMTSQRTSLSEILLGFLTILVIGALTLTGALVIVGGAYVLGDPAVRMVLGALLLIAAVVLAHQHRHRAELMRDRRLRVARERRGF